MLNFDFLKKGLGLVSAPYLGMMFQENVSHVRFYQLTKFHCLIVFTSGNIGQYVYGSCFFPRL